jgi:hypothetical protein
MNPLDVARAYGVEVVVEDLGDWGAAQLVAEYDPEGPVIRVHSSAGDRFAAAVAHELYHHRERIGEVPRLKDRPQRERAAHAYAIMLLGAPSGSHHRSTILRGPGNGGPKRSLGGAEPGAERLSNERA